MIISIIKSLLLIVGIVYSFSNFVKAKRGQDIFMPQLLLMAIGIVGFIFLQFWM